MSWLFQTKIDCIYIDIGLFPCPVTVTTRIMTFLVGNHSPSFATVTGRGDGTTHIYIYILVTILYMCIMLVVQLQKLTKKELWEVIAGERVANITR